MASPIAVIRKSLNQLTDHGSQKCLDCLEHRRRGMEATEEIQARIDDLEEALWRIAAPPRQDGTYNISRERCEQIAREALGSPNEPNVKTVTKSADLPVRAASARKDG